MSRIFFAILLLWSCAAKALPHYYQFEHDLVIAGRNFSAIIVLPRYFARHFGILDELDFELREQDLNPVPDEKIIATLKTLQAKLWKTYSGSPFLSGKNINDPEFASFRGIETFLDGRSAVFAIVEKEHPGEVFEVPFELEAMVRMSSLVDPTAKDPMGRLFQSMLPFDLRALFSEEAREQREKYPKRFVAEFKNHPVEYSPVFLERDAKLGRAKTEIACWQGAPLELKAWFHQPKVLKILDGGKTRTEVIDFLPDLLNIALMYGGFDRTGVSAAALAHDEASQKNLEQVLKAVSALIGKPVTAKDIGIRAGEFWTEVIELPLANREREDFDMDLRLEFEDYHFKGYRNHVLWTTRDRLLPALSLWAGKRPGAKLLPLSRLVVKRRENIKSCVASLLHPGVERLAHPSEQVQAIGIYLR